MDDKTLTNTHIHTRSLYSRVHKQRLFVDIYSHTLNTKIKISFTTMSIIISLNLRISINTNIEVQNVAVKVTYPKLHAAAGVSCQSELRLECLPGS